MSDDGGDTSLMRILSRHVSAPDGVQQAIADGVRSARLARWFELTLLVVALVLALFAGMNELYIGKLFGTFWDYVVLITWGLLAPPALVAVSTALNNVGSLSALVRKLRT